MTTIPSEAHNPNLGTLYLIPAPLDWGCAPHHQVPLEQVMPHGTLALAATLRHWICENAKSTRAYIKRIETLYPLSLPVQLMNLQELPHAIHKKGDHLGEFDARYLLQAALSGENIGLVSEAGMPAVADPGSSVVRAAHAMGLRVIPMVGPVSLLLMLAASGLNGQNFAFVGYLPSTPAPRLARIKALESLARTTGQTQIFIETPYRNTAMLQALLQSLEHNTRLATASGLTLPYAECRSETVKNWRGKAWTLDNATPTVFAIGQ